MARCLISWRSAARARHHTTEAATSPTDMTKPTPNSRDRPARIYTTKPAPVASGKITSHTLHGKRRVLGLGVLPLPTVTFTLLAVLLPRRPIQRGHGRW